MGTARLVNGDRGATLHIPCDEALARPEMPRSLGRDCAPRTVTTKQAAEAGYSPQLLVHYVHIGRAVRVRRGIYRLVHFPAGEHEELVAAWLWSELAGVVSPQTALATHGVGDGMQQALGYAEMLDVPFVFSSNGLERKRIVAEVEHPMKVCDDLEAKLRRAKDRAARLVVAVVRELVA